MKELRSPQQEAAEDIFFGQVVIIWARWFVILTGAILALWAASSISELTVASLLIVTLMAVNFFVHGRYLMEKPINRTLTALVSLVDLAIITLIVLAWRGQTGLDSPFFIFYYPVLAAFAFVFSPRLTLFYTGLALLSYVGATFVGAMFVSDPGFFLDAEDLKLLITRLITLAAMGGLGTYYWRIQRQRRRLAGNPQPQPASRSRAPAGD
ncbi:MAG: hypothetical protein ACE5M4_02015 [Anaerolineales bacterium]